MLSNPFLDIHQELVEIKKVLQELSKPVEDPKPEHFTVKETAEFLKVSEQSVHNYIKKGFIPAQKIGRIILIKRIDLENALVEVKSLKYKRS